MQLQQQQLVLFDLPRNPLPKFGKLLLRRRPSLFGSIQGGGQLVDPPCMSRKFLLVLTQREDCLLQAPQFVCARTRSRRCLLEFRQQRMKLFDGLNDRWPRQGPADLPQGLP